MSQEKEVPPRAHKSVSQEYRVSKVIITIKLSAPEVCVDICQSISAHSNM